MLSRSLGRKVLRAHSSHHFSRFQTVPAGLHPPAWGAAGGEIWALCVRFPVGKAVVAANERVKRDGQGWAGRLGTSSAASLLLNSSPLPSST